MTARGEHDTGDGQPAGAPCGRCGCPRNAHQHDTGNSHPARWCGNCGCPLYTRPRPWARLAAWWRQARRRPPRPARRLPVPAAEVTILQPRPVPLPISRAEGEDWDGRTYLDLWRQLDDDPGGEGELGEAS